MMYSRFRAMISLQEFVTAAEAMLRDDVADNQSIGRHGLAAVRQVLKEKGVPAENLRVLTHCNTGRWGGQ